MAVANRTAAFVRGVVARLTLKIRFVVPASPSRTAPSFAKAAGRNTDVVAIALLMVERPPSERDMVVRFVKDPVALNEPEIVIVLFSPPPSVGM